MSSAQPAPTRFGIAAFICLASPWQLKAWLSVHPCVLPYSAPTCRLLFYIKIGVIPLPSAISRIPCNLACYPQVQSREV